MERVVNGIKYDTKTADFLGMWDNGLEREEFYYCCVKLYKQTEGYFLFRSEPYCRTSTGRSQRRESIRPIDSDEARNWARINLPYPEYSRIFG